MHTADFTPDLTGLEQDYQILTELGVGYRLQLPPDVLRVGELSSLPSHTPVTRFAV